MIFNFRPFLGLNSIKKHDVHQGSTIPQRCIESPQQIIGRFMISKQIYSK
jgi:hypothetical protein